MERCDFFHLLLAQDGRNLHKRLRIVRRLEQWELSGQEKQHDDAYRPDVEG